MGQLEGCGLESPDGSLTPVSGDWCWYWLRPQLRLLNKYLHVVCSCGLCFVYKMVAEFQRQMSQEERASEENSYHLLWASLGNPQHYLHYVLFVEAVTSPTRGEGKRTPPVDGWAVASFWKIMGEWKYWYGPFWKTHFAIDTTLYRIVRQASLKVMFKHIKVREWVMFVFGKEQWKQGQRPWGRLWWMDLNHFGWSQVSKGKSSSGKFTE